MTVPTYLSYEVLGVSIATIAAILVGLGLALARAGWPDRERKAAVQVTAAVLIGITRIRGAV